MLIRHFQPNNTVFHNPTKHVYTYTGPYNKINPQLYFRRQTAWKHPKYPCFCILALEVEVVIDIYIDIKAVRFYVQTTINLQRKCLRTPDCNYMENMLRDFNWLNVKATSLLQGILYQFQWDKALWMSPKCPQHMQQIWWQTVATQHTWLRVLHVIW